MVIILFFPVETLLTHFGEYLVTHAWRESLEVHYLKQHYVTFYPPKINSFMLVVQRVVTG